MTSALSDMLSTRIRRLQKKWKRVLCMDCNGQGNNFKLITMGTKQAAVYLHGNTLQYRLEESVYQRPTRQVTQLFTYLLSYKLFSSCIRRCQRYLPCYLLSISNSVCFSSIYRLLGRTYFCQFPTDQHRCPKYCAAIGF